MNKLIRNGKVGVIISPGFGGGWSTWSNNTKMLFDPMLVEMIERKKVFQYATDEYENLLEMIREYCHSQNYEEYGVEDLVVVWVEQNRKFIIDEYDGSESIRFEDEIDWIIP